MTVTAEQIAAAGTCHGCSRFTDGACGVDRAPIRAHALALYCPHPDEPQFGTGAAPDGWDALVKRTTPPLLPARVPPTPRPPVQPVPREQWPRAVRWIAERRRRPTDIGVGDTVGGMIGDVRSERFKRAFLWLTGYDCGCADRQARLNVMYPYWRGTGTN